MTSFYYASIPTHGNWFQTNQPEHEWDDHAGDPVTSVCVTNEKDMALQWQIWSTFVTVLWCRKKQNYRCDWDIGSCEMWFPRFTDNFGKVSSKMHLKAVAVSIPSKLRGEKWYVQFVWHQCQCQRDVCIHYVSLYQCILYSVSWTKCLNLLEVKWLESEGSILGI